MFGGSASTMEECRAEAVGIYLCVQPRVLSIFGHGAAGAEDIVYVNWLNMARAGLLALQFYSPATKAWGQAHMQVCSIVITIASTSPWSSMQARFVLLRVMLEAGAGFVDIRGFDAGTGTVALDEGDAGVHIVLDRTKIRSVGVPAVGDFLRRLQARRSLH
jgi:dipeptidyl-peptidase-3